MTEESIRTLHLRTGMLIADVARSANLHLNYSRLYDNTSITIDYAARVIYDDPQHGLELPPGRFVFLSQQGGVITGFATSNALQYVDLETAHRTASLIMDHFSAAHWRAAATFPNDLETARRINREKSANEEFRMDFGDWEFGSVTATVYVKEHASPLKGDTFPQFLPNVEFTDIKLDDQMSQRVYQRRKERTGSLDGSLPLSEWVH